MIIECKKTAEGYKPVKGNEKEIINHLLEHDYYNYWKVKKDNEIIVFNINDEPFFTNGNAFFFKCESDGKIIQVWDKYDFIDYTAVPFDASDNDMLRIFQAPNFVSFERKHTVAPSLKKWSLKTTTKTFAVSYRDIIIFDNDWRIIDCLINDHEWYSDILESNGYIVERY